MMRNSSSDGYDSPCASTSSSLLDRIKIRDPAAWERFVDLYTPLVYRWCRRTGVTADDAPDVVQEVFLAVATHIEHFRRDRPGDSFRGWLWTITCNKIHDHVRRRKHLAKARGGSSAEERLCRIADRLPSVLDADQASSDDAALAQRVVELIRPEVEDRTWQAFWRLAVDGQPGRDVAAELGMNLRAVYQAKYRVLQRARQELDGLTENVLGPGTWRQFASKQSAT
jgi:RNA polymerase sigma-70 factor, ECF subfamily